jgi:hypothetical protein
MERERATGEREEEKNLEVEAEGRLYICFAGFASEAEEVDNKQLRSTRRREKPFLAKSATRHLGHTMQDQTAGKN